MSLHSWCCLMNRKVKFFKQCFYQNSVQCQNLQQVFKVQSFSLDTGPQLFCLSFIALLIMLFEVSPEVDCSGVSGCHCCHGNHATGSKQISKPFTLVNWVLNNVSLYQKWLVNVVIWRRFVILITAVWFFKGSVCVIKQSNRCVWQTFYIHQWLFVLSLTLSNGWHISVWDSLRRWCWIRITLTSSVRLECRTVDC